jgi:hypothetical protein
MNSCVIDFSNEAFSFDPLWPEKESDIKSALKIIDENSDNGQFKFIESFEEKGDDLTIVMPQWLMAMFKYFDPLYRELTGELVNQIIRVVFHPFFGLEPSQTRAERLFLRQA